MSNSQTNLNNMKKEKRIAIRLESELHQKCVDLAIKKSVKEKRIVKVSEIIREAIDKFTETNK